MSIREDAKYALDLGRDVLADLGEIWWIYRPDYTGTPSVNNEILVCQRPFLTQPEGSHYAEPRLNGVDYYSVYGDETDLLPGDVLIDVNGVAPVMTLVNFYNMKEIVTMRTGRVGQLWNSLQDSAPVVNNVRYDFLRSATPESGQYPVLASDDSIPLRKIVIFDFPVMHPENSYVQGMKFLESDGTLSPPKRWEVIMVESIKPVIVITLKEER